FRLDAPGLKLLSDQGPYGASLTVLDMENKKVLGQSVLFASSSPATFSAATTSSPRQSPASEPTVKITHSDLAGARTNAQSDTIVTINPLQPNRSLTPGSTVLLAIAAVALGAALAFARNRLTRKQPAA